MQKFLVSIPQNCLQFCGRENTKFSKVLEINKAPNVNGAKGVKDMKNIARVDIEMPQSCDKCPFIDTLSDFPNFYCDITNELINDGEEIDEQRHSTCPLRLLKK